MSNWTKQLKWKTRQHGVRLLCLLIMALFLLQAKGIVRFDFFDRLENIAYDVRLRLTMPNKDFPGIAIVDIDEKSLAEEGRWPWGRDRVALLVSQLFDKYHVSAAGFDIVFAEPDDGGLKILKKLEQENSSKDYLETLEKIRPGLDHDKLLANALAGKPVVLGYYFAQDNRRSSGKLPAPLFTGADFKGAETDFVTARSYGANLPILQQSAFGGGDFNDLPDFDGITRRVPMLIKYQGNYYESLSLGLARAVLGDDMVQPPVVSKSNTGYSSVEWLEVGGQKIPLDENARSLIPYRGGEKTFHYISATDVIHGRVKAKELAGKIVLVGTSATGLLDLRATPVDETFPGVEIHANMLTGILTQTIKQLPPYSAVVNIATLFIVGMLLIAFLPKLSVVKATLIVLAGLLFIVMGNLAAWKYGNIVIPLASPMLLTISLFVIDMSFGYFLETRAKRQISELFGQYVPPKLVDEMSRNPDMFDMKSESREMTVMFSDIRDFTRISEGLDPESLSSMINEYLTAMTKVIYDHGGTVDKYIGDAIMAFWGAPVHNTSHAQDSALAAMEMHEVLRNLNVRFKAKDWPELRIGIGINSGLMNVGNMGSSFRKAYTVMGDSVNLASRLEGLTKYYGAGALVSSDTMKATNGIVFQEVDRVMVKGKIEPLTIYQPLGYAGKVGESELRDAAMFEKALEFYRLMDWDACLAILKALSQAKPDKLLYSLYIERIAAFIDHPPPSGWNGVYAFQTK
ncbi:MAG: adenylate/guanylate cyclase domain-containing protein [Burkholderiales bacterium]|nr:adenylate/guanylate cyclase domain-containing protein [Burkholderiales bacterium]